MSENDVLPEREWAEGNRNHGASGGINEGGGGVRFCARPPVPGGTLSGITGMLTGCSGD